MIETDDRIIDGVGVKRIIGFGAYVVAYMPRIDEKNFRMGIYAIDHATVKMPSSRRWKQLE